MKKTLLALLCGIVLALPSVANAAKHSTTRHKHAHAAKKVKRTKHASASPAGRNVAAVAPAPVAAAAPAPVAAAAPAPVAAAPRGPAQPQIADDEMPRK
jgi:hypothetical protein